MTDLPITAIRIGERRREDMGDIDGLAASIEAHGLFHPIVVDDDGNLIAGHRRFLACQSLGWTMLPTRSLGELDDDERWECEQDENRQRKDWTPYEEAKQRVVQAQRDAPFISSTADEKDARGRKPKAAVSHKELAQAQGISEGALVNAEQHVETAETYPFMQSPDWSQTAVLEARKALARMEEPAREAAVAIISEPAVPADSGIAILRNMVEMKPAERAEIAQLYVSEDPRDQSLAKTKAIALPPMPDPRFLQLGTIVRELKTCAKLVPGDVFTTEILSYADSLLDLRERLQQAYREKVNGSSNGTAARAEA